MVAGPAKARGRFVSKQNSPVSPSVLGDPVALWVQCHPGTERDHIIQSRRVKTAETQFRLWTNLLPVTQEDQQMMPKPSHHRSPVILNTDRLTSRS